MKYRNELLFPKKFELESAYEDLPNKYILYHLKWYMVEHPIFSLIFNFFDHIFTLNNLIKYFNMFITNQINHSNIKYIYL